LRTVTIPWCRLTYGLARTHSAAVNARTSPCIFDDLPQHADRPVEADQSLE
jgi:hypothetical protein